MTDALKRPLLVVAIAAALAPTAACSRDSAQSEPAAPSRASQATAPSPQTSEQESAPAELPIHGYRIVETYPHDTRAFTQGLLWRDGHLYEGTGRHHESSIRRVALESGEVLAQKDLSGEFFGEGIVDWGDRIIGLTWRSGTAFVYDSETLEQVGTFNYQGEGWGITRNDTHLIMSDGSDTLRFLNPETFEVERRLPVTIRGKPLVHINELEWVEGEIFANIWQTDAIARIDPETGRVTGLVNLTGLSQEAGIGPSRDLVLNGIAWDAQGERLFVTGKYWPKLFEIEITAPAQ